MTLKTARKRRWSLVRVMASLVPEILWKYILPKPKRIDLTQNVYFVLGGVNCGLCHAIASPVNFNSFKAHLNGVCEGSGLPLNSTPKTEVIVNDSRITNLQRELEALKDEVARIRLPRETGRGLRERSPPATDSDVVVRSTPRRPPPPPPPLPANLLAKTPGRRKEEEEEMRAVTPLRGPPRGIELLADLKSVRLKKVQKSPGGGPVKVDRPSCNALEEVLRMRFNRMQNTSSDTDSTTLIISDASSQQG